MEKDLTKIHIDIRNILFEEYRLKSIADFEVLDGELLAEIYQQLKYVMEEHGIDDDEMENILDGIDD